MQFNTNLHSKYRKYKFAKIIINIRLANTNNISAAKLLKEALNKNNLTNDYMITILRRKRDSEHEYRETIKIYDDSTNLEKTNKNINNYAKRQDTKNNKKIERIKEENLYKNLNNNEIKSSFSKENKLNIILDNY